MNDSFQRQLFHYVALLMLAGLARALQEAGLDVLRPVELPPGDGAVALGQAVVARTFLRMRA